MSAIHSATSSDRSREMRDVVCGFLRRWADLKYPAGRHDLAVGRRAVLDMIEEADDHIGIDIGVTLAVWQAIDSMGGGEQ